MQLLSEEIYRIAHNLQYNKKDTLTAYYIYKEVITTYPSSPEAGYSKTQIENLEKINAIINSLITPVVIEKAKSILDAGILAENNTSYITDDSFDYEKEKKIEDIIMTTTNYLDGYTVEKYFSIDSVEIVLGSGLMNEIVSDITDAFNLRSNTFEINLQYSKNTAIHLFKEKAYLIGANAIIGVDFDYAVFPHNRVALIISGTIVKVKPVSESLSKQNAEL